jgi:hypothetical protein
MSCHTCHVIHVIHLSLNVQRDALLQRRIGVASSVGDQSANESRLDVSDTAHQGGSRAERADDSAQVSAVVMGKVSASAVSVAKMTSAFDWICYILDNVQGCLGTEVAVGSVRNKVRVGVHVFREGFAEHQSFFASQRDARAARELSVPFAGRASVHGKNGDSTLNGYN